MSDWQPIETAPKDGTKIDLWLQYSDGNGERVPDGFWSTEGFPSGPRGGDREEGWAAANMGYDGSDGWADDPNEGELITYWMPVPAPPPFTVSLGGILPVDPMRDIPG